MFLVNINDILYVWTIHYNIFPHHVYTKCPYVIYTNILLSICGIEFVSISGIEKKIFVYISYVHFVYT